MMIYSDLLDFNSNQESITKIKIQQIILIKIHYLKIVLILTPHTKILHKISANTFKKITISN